MQFESLSTKDDAFDYLEGNADGSWCIRGISMLPQDTVGKSKFRIEGIVEGENISRLCLMEDIKRSPQLHYFISIPVRNNRFAKDIYVDMPARYMLHSWHDDINDGRYAYDFISEPNATVVMKIGNGKREFLNATGEEMKKFLSLKEKEYELWKPITGITDKIDSLHRAKAGYAPEFYNYLELLNSGLQIANRDSLMEILDYYEKNPLPCLAALEAEEDSARIKLYYTDYPAILSENPSFYGLATLTYRMDCDRYGKYKGKGKDIYLAIYDKVYSTLYPNHPYHIEYAAIKSLNVGEPYIDYTIHGNNDEVLEISSLIKGKVAIIHLWASWCGPCRLEGRGLIPLYNKYKEKGLTVVGIAREKSPDIMRQALARENYSWENYIELQDEHNIWIKHGINSSGALYVVDTDGTVLAINPSAEEIERILEEKLGSN